MSVRVSNAVFRESRSTGAARLVLLALADVAGDCGEVSAYKRSQSILAAKAAVDERTVRKAIRTLEELGEIEVLVVGDGRTRSDYRILLPGLDDDTEGRAGRASGPPSEGVRAGQGGPEAPPITPSLIHPDPSSSIASAKGSNPFFEVFWQSYPKRNGVRVGKVASLKLWGRLKPEERAAAVAGVEAYARAKEAYPEDPERYLKNKRWVGIEVETEEDRSARAIAGAEKFAEFFNVKEA